MATGPTELLSAERFRHRRSRQRHERLWQQLQRPRYAQLTSATKQLLEITVWASDNLGGRCNFQRVIALSCDALKQASS